MNTDGLQTGGATDEVLRQEAERTNRFLGSFRIVVRGDMWVLVGATINPKIVEGLPTARTLARHFATVQDQFAGSWLQAIKS